MNLTDLKNKFIKFLILLFIDFIIIIIMIFIEIMSLNRKYYRLIY